MKRSTAVDIIFHNGLDHCGGTVLWEGQPCILLNLSAPHQVCQMARIEIEGKRQWVPLGQLSLG